MHANGRVVPARIHLLAAKSAPYVVVIRRKPSKRYHIIRWNTATDEFEYGSWFSGRIYEYTCDVSFDGKFMVYVAMGDHGTCWTGICKLPDLRTYLHWNASLVDCPNGEFVSADELVLSIRPDRLSAEQLENFQHPTAELPLKLSFLADSPIKDNWGWLYSGYFHLGYKSGQFEDGVAHRPTPDHPALRVRYLNSLRGHVMDLPEYPEMLDHEVTCARYDSLGQLIVARRGVLYRYTLEDIRAGRPSAVFDLEPLMPPPRPPKSEVP